MDDKVIQVEVFRSSVRKVWMVKVKYGFNLDKYKTLFRYYVGSIPRLGIKPTTACNLVIKSIIRNMNKMDVNDKVSIGLSGYVMRMK